MRYRKETENQVSHKCFPIIKQCEKKNQSYLAKQEKTNLDTHNSGCIYSKKIWH